MGSTTGPLARFVLLYVALSATYACKAGIPAALPRILRESPHLDLVFVGLLSTGFSTAYSVAKLSGGLLVDMADPKWVLLAAMLVSIAGSFLFDLLAKQALVHTLIWSMVGYAQGLVWLPAARLLTTWWHPDVRSTLWGVLSSAQTLGGMLLPLLFAQTVVAEQDVLFGSFVELTSLLFLLPFCLAAVYLSPPADLDLSKSAEQKTHQPTNNHDTTTTTTTAAAAPSSSATAQWRSYVAEVRQLLSQHHFWLLGAGTMCAVLSRDSSSDYIVIRGILLDALSESDAARYRLSWQVGGMLSSLTSGFFCQRFVGGRTGLLCALAMFAAALAHFDGFAVPLVRGSFLLACLHNAVKGMLFFIPSTLCSFMVTQVIRADASCIATAVGLVGVFAGVGSSVGGIVTPFVLQSFGWSAHHLLIFAVSMLSALMFLLYDMSLARRAQHFCELPLDDNDSHRSSTSATEM